MSKTLPDTNVFSRIFDGDKGIRELVEDSDAAIDATIYIECLQGAKSNYEKLAIKRYLSNFPLLLITPSISKRAIRLIDAYSNSFGLFLPDALIASSALEKDLTLLTYNVNDFKFIQGLNYLKPSI